MVLRPDITKKLAWLGTRSGGSPKLHQHSVCLVRIYVSKLIGGHNNYFGGTKRVLVPINRISRGSQFIQTGIGMWDGVFGIWDSINLIFGMVYFMATGPFSLDQKVLWGRDNWRKVPAGPAPHLPNWLDGEVALSSEYLKWWESCRRRRQSLSVLVQGRGNQIVMAFVTSSLTHNWSHTDLFCGDSWKSSKHFHSILKGRAPWTYFWQLRKITLAQPRAVGVLWHVLLHQHCAIVL